MNRHPFSRWILLERYHFIVHTYTRKKADEQNQVQACTRVKILTSVGLYSPKFCREYLKVFTPFKLVVLKVICTFVSALTSKMAAISMEPNRGETYYNGTSIIRSPTELCQKDLNWEVTLLQGANVLLFPPWNTIWDWARVTVMTLLVRRGSPVRSFSLHLFILIIINMQENEWVEKWAKQFSDQHPLKYYRLSITGH